MLLLKYLVVITQVWFSKPDQNQTKNHTKPDQTEKISNIFMKSYHNDTTPKPYQNQTQSDNIITSMEIQYITIYVILEL